MTIILCDLSIKEILNGNRPGTHSKKEGWVNIVKNFENETGKSYTQKQLKNQWDLLKKEWRLWKKLKEKNIGLGWNPIKETVDASEEWWESRLKVVPEAQGFKLAGIDPELEDKLDQMFKEIVATGDKVWAPSGILPTDFVEHGYNETLEEIEENNATDIHTTTASMNEATSRLNPITDPFGIPHAVKVLEELSEEVPEAIKLYFFTLKLIANKEKQTMLLSIPQRVRVRWLNEEMEDSLKFSGLLSP
ncbi:hypothetical protein V6N12_049724 [Hibiscus sabdariffa]|uniref:Myb/SANT-like domain-containing protein n=1 Tax=Hibiscus sabdariffa TaxID=183260 RepID=A0ABR2GBG7_9ROSI